MSGVGQGRIAYEAILLIASRLAGAVVSLGTGVILVRSLSRTDYGTFLQVELVTTTVGLAVSLGMPRSLYYFVPALRPEERKNLLVHTTAILLVLYIVAAGMLYLFRRPLGEFLNNPSISLLALPIVFYLFVQSLNQCIDPAFISLKWIRDLSILKLVVPLGFGLAIIIPAVAGSSMAAMLLSGTIFHVAVLAEIGRRVSKLNGSISISRWPDFLRSQLHYSVPLGAAAIVSAAHIRLDKFLVARWYSPETFAIYARGAFDLPLIAIVTYTLISVLTPVLVTLRQHKDRDGIVRAWHDTNRLSLLLIVPSVMFAWIMAREIIVVLFTEEYVESAIIFQLYLFIALLQAPVLSAVLQAFANTGSFLAATTIGLVTNVGFNLILLPLDSIVGPALAVVAAQACVTWFLLWRTRVALEIGFLQTFEWKIIGRIIAAATIAGLAISVNAGPRWDGLVGLGIRGCVFGVLYTALVMWMGVVRPGEKRLAVQWLRGVGLWKWVL